MKNINKDRRLVNRVLWLLIFAFVIRSAFFVSGAEEKFDVLRTRTGTYRDVTVTKKTQEWVFILHAEGMGNVRISDLSPDARRRLGYSGAVAASESGSAGSPVSAANFSAPEETATTGAAPAQNAKLPAVFSKMPTSLPKVSINWSILLIVLAVLVVIHLFFSFCCRLICLKAHASPGFLVWLPGLQMIPLLRAANMSVLWFFAFFIPLLNLVASVVWSFKIVQERGKAPWVAVLLLLPVTSIFAFLYLAFSDEAPAGGEVGSSSSMLVLGAA